MSLRHKYMYTCIFIMFYIFEVWNRQMFIELGVIVSNKLIKFLVSHGMLKNFFPIYKESVNWKKTFHCSIGLHYFAVFGGSK